MSPALVTSSPQSRRVDPEPRACTTSSNRLILHDRESFPNSVLAVTPNPKEGLAASGLLVISPPGGPLPVPAPPRPRHCGLSYYGQPGCAELQSAAQSGRSGIPLWGDCLVVTHVSCGKHLVECLVLVHPHPALVPGSVTCVTAPDSGSHPALHTHAQPWQSARAGSCARPLPRVVGA